VPGPEQARGLGASENHCRSRSTRLPPVGGNRDCGRAAVSGSAEVIVRRWRAWRDPSASIAHIAYNRGHRRICTNVRVGTAEKGVAVRTWPVVSAQESPACSSASNQIKPSCRRGRPPHLVGSVAGGRYGERAQHPMVAGHRPQPAFARRPSASGRRRPNDQSRRPTGAACQPRAQACSNPPTWRKRPSPTARLTAAVLAPVHPARQGGCGPARQRVRSAGPGAWETRASPSGGMGKRR